MAFLQLISAQLYLVLRTHTSSVLIRLVGLVLPLGDADTNKIKELPGITATTAPNIRAALGVPLSFMARPILRSVWGMMLILALLLCLTGSTIR
jgi:hypothetical protein